MTISFPVLLKVGNFSQDKIDQLMENIDYVSEEDKIKLSDIAWQNIATRYYANYAVYEIQYLDEIKQGKRKYNANDFEEVKAKLLHELLEKFQLANTESSISEVRKRLDQFSPAK